METKTNRTSSKHSTRKHKARQRGTTTELDTVPGPIGWQLEMFGPQDVVVDGREVGLGKEALGQCHVSGPDLQAPQRVSPTRSPHLPRSHQQAQQRAALEASGYQLWHKGLAPFGLQRPLRGPRPAAQPRSRRREGTTSGQGKACWQFVQESDQWTKSLCASGACFLQPAMSMSPLRLLPS